jgi:hypothetical protein
MIQLTFDDDTIWNYLGNTPWTSTAPSSERPGVTYKEEFCVFIDEMHQWFTVNEGELVEAFQTPV